MPAKVQDEWLEVREAAAIMSRKNNREVKPDYVRLLAHKGHIRMKEKDKRTNLYYRPDIEAYQVRTNKKREATVAPPSEQAA